MDALERFKRLVEKTKRYIRKLQRSDESTKKRWLIGGAAGAMVLLIVFWVVYLQVTLPLVAEVGEVSAPVPEQEKETFFNVFVRGIGVVGAQFKTGVESVTSALRNIVEYAKKSIPKGLEYSF